MSVIGFVVMLITGLVTLGMVGCPKYAVYSQRMDGEALLAKSLSSKQVAVSEAKAKMEAASLLAQAEIERARGVAAANKIIGESLRENEAYLRYLWITEVANQNQGKTVVYIPTEANLPILEAQRIGGAK
jgi:regulator of protease activity HflC (stomatin/prohibitin superfamily)